ncbi:MAG TPA: Hpt domain-containing protein [Sulfurovum sp.]|uniref:Hpt domain-containing protein n=1 Tax=Sulfurovum sp. TaxID=1969726 RepID=UPI002F947F5D
MHIDKDEIASRLGFTRRDFDMLLVMFNQNATSSLEEMKHAIDKKDMQGIADAAHAIGGGAGNIQLNDIYEFAMRIELSAKKNENADYHLFYEQLKILIDSI